jgi:hypothetical protein
LSNVLVCLSQLILELQLVLFIPSVAGFERIQFRFKLLKAKAAAHLADLLSKKVIVIIELVNNVVLSADLSVVFPFLLILLSIDLVYLSHDILDLVLQV